MTVQVRLSQRLAELAGFRVLFLSLAPRATVREALASFRERLGERARAQLVIEGRLHPCVLVCVNGVANAFGADVPLAGDDEIELLLPVAGG